MIIIMYLIIIIQCSKLKGMILVCALFQDYKSIRVTHLYDHQAVAVTNDFLYLRILESVVLKQCTSMLLRCFVGSVQVTHQIKAHFFQKTTLNGKLGCVFCVSSQEEDRKDLPLFPKNNSIHKFTLSVYRRGFIIQPSEAPREASRASLIQTSWLPGKQPDLGMLILLLVYLYDLKFTYYFMSHMHSFFSLNS